MLSLRSSPKLRIYRSKAVIFQCRKSWQLSKTKEAKPTMDSTDLKSYCPATNLSFDSKVVERLAANSFNADKRVLVCRQLVNQFICRCIQGRLQSSLRTRTSIELCALNSCQHWCYSNVAQLLASLINVFC